MAEVNAVIVPKFEGIKQPGYTSKVTTRRPLNEPREMYNFHLTREGHLYMPRAAELVHDFSAEGVITQVHYVETPRGLLVQCSNGKIFHIGIEPPSSTQFYDPMVIKHVATTGVGEEQWPIWVNGISGGTLFGYCPRGTAGPDGDGRTWRLHGDPANPDTENLTVYIGRNASSSQMYKGRRFWVGRGRNVSYTPLNEPAEPEEGRFRPGGDDSGDSYLANPGFIQGFASMEGFLVIFFSGSTWILTGASIENWQIRQAQTMVGNVSYVTIVPIGEGVITFGGANLNTRGVYLFTGNNAVLLSDDINSWLAQSPGTRTSATFSAGHYILSTGRSDPDARQFLLVDLQTYQWAAFDGFVRGVVTTQSSRIVVSGEGKLYRNTNETLPRYPGRGARIRLGYMDDQNPSGLARFQAVKLAGRRWGTGEPKVRITATTDTGSVTSAWIDVPTDVFDSLVVPINLRGAAIEFWLEFTAPNDDNELLIENLQLIASRKGEKVSRG